MIGRGRPGWASRRWLTDRNLEVRMRNRIEIDGTLYERVAGMGKPLEKAPTINQITKHRKTIAFGRTLRIETVYHDDDPFEEYAVKLMPIGQSHIFYILVIDLNIDNEDGTADLSIATQGGSTARYFDGPDGRKNITDAKRLFDQVSKWIFGKHDIDMDEEMRSAMHSVFDVADEASEKFGLEED